MNKGLSTRLLLCSLLVNLILALIAGYGWLRYQDQQQSLQHALQQESSTRQAMLQGRVEYQALLSLRDGLQARLAEQDRQLAEQTQQLVLYRQVLAPVGGRELILNQGDIMPLAEPGRFQFRLVLLQPDREADRITGRARIRVQVMRQDEIVGLGEQELGLAPVLLDFRHFQILSGQLQLPEGAEGRQFEVLLELDGRTDKTLSLEWPLPDNT